MRFNLKLLLLLYPILYCSYVNAADLSSDLGEEIKSVLGLEYQTSHGMGPQEIEIHRGEGLTNSLFSLGYEHFEKKNYAEAIPLLNQASNQKHFGASYYLYLYYRDMEKNTGQADVYYRQSDEQLFDILKRYAQEERDQEVMVRHGLSEGMYIPVQAADTERIDDDTPFYPLIDKVEEFLRPNSGKDVLILQGNSGAGKSLFGRYLEKKLLDEKSPYIPLFIRLAQLYVPHKDIIQKALLAIGIPEPIIEHLKSNKAFLIILDGYDEIPGKPALMEELRMNATGQWQGKAFISSRTQYLSPGELQILYPVGDTLYQRAQKCLESYVVPFTPDQINQYIAAFCKTSFKKKGWEKADYDKALEQFQEVKEFLKEPFLLFLTLSVLPKLYTQDLPRDTGLVKRIDLYKAYTTRLFKRQLKKFPPDPDSLLYNNPSILEEYTQNFAFEMLHKETPTVQKPTDPNDQFYQFFQDKEEVQIGFQGSPLRRIGNTYTFIHRSFQEYFVAELILNEYEELKKIFKEKGMVPKQNIQNLRMNKVSFVPHPAIQQFVADKIQQDPQLQELLFEVIYASRPEHA